MGTIQVIRREVFTGGPAQLVGRSPARTLLGGVDIADIGLQVKYLAAMDMVMLQKVGQQFLEVPPGLRSRLFGASVTTPGGGLVGTVENFEDPLQPVVKPLVVISPQFWPPPKRISVWRRVLPQSAIQVGLAVSLLLPTGEILGEITQAPQQLPYWDAYHSALTVQAKFSTTIRTTAHGAPAVSSQDRETLVGMLIGTQPHAGGTLVNIFPMAAA